MTREEILEAAAQIIREKGFHATSMQDIAQAVDLRKASLYHHVNSKQEILVDLLDQALAQLNQQIEAVVAEAIPADQKFRKALRSYLNYTAENLDLAVVLLLEHRSLEPQYRERHIPHRDRYEAYWLQIIQEGIQAGLFQALDPHLAVKAVLGVANWTVMWLNPKGKLSATQVADFSADLLLEGFYKRGETNHHVG
ncbi:MAG TPA: TetR/AcrR family transcriptional regulator [Chloroflexi bacterium]|nr:TetR/AcrR family transcriptional regulator [Chloroflexota bacterium]